MTQSPALPREEAQTPAAWRRGRAAGSARGVTCPSLVAFPGPQRISLRRDRPLASHGPAGCALERVTRLLPRTWCAEAGHRSPLSLRRVAQKEPNLLAHRSPRLGRKPRPPAHHHLQSQRHCSAQDQVRARGERAPAPPRTQPAARSMPAGLQGPE